MKTILLNQTVATINGCYVDKKTYTVSDELAADFIKAGFAIEVIVTEPQPVVAPVQQTEPTPEQPPEAPVEPTPTEQASEAKSLKAKAKEAK